MSDEQEARQVPLLSAMDVQSQTWLKLKAHIEARINSLRAKNDGDLDPIATAKLRGSLRALSNLLTLATPAPADVADDD
jgi:hypothetical protein